MKIKKTYLIILIYIYLEVLLKLLSFENFFTLGLLNIVIYTTFVSLLTSFIISLFKERGQKILFYSFLWITSIYFATQYCIYNVYRLFYSFNVSSATGQVFDFMDEIVAVITNNFVFIILFLLPAILTVVFRKKISFEKSKKKTIILLITSLLVFGIFNLILLIDKDKEYSGFNLLYKYYDISLSVETLGLFNTFHQDIIKNIIDFKEDVVLIPGKIEGLEPDEPQDIIYEPNLLDLNFDAIEGNSSVEQLNEFFKADTGTLKNEYTGLFEGKNLIYIMAETFNEIVVDENATPTLYKLVNNGFVFENFYSPTISSTIGGEFQLLMGLYPATGFVSTFQGGNNTFTYGLGNMFKNEGYNAYSYHNNTYSFQDRNVYLNSIGFDYYKGCWNGLEKLMDCNWLQSDQDMMDVTFSEYSNSDKPFITFYATVSGHGGYSIYGEFSKEYLHLYDDTDYSDETKAYLSTNVELDRALESLINNLDKEGILEDTVIVLSGDHYPYLLPDALNKINEVSDYEKDGVIEIDHSNLIIWNSEMEPVEVSKVGSQIDVLPTVYNLFGIDYDSRLIVGKDILSTEPGLAIFGNRSWVSDYGRYYASTGNFVPKEGVTVPEDYVSLMNQSVQSKINLSGLILSTNYYKYFQ